MRLKQRRQPHLPVGRVAADVQEHERVADRLLGLGAEAHLAVRDLAIRRLLNLRSATESIGHDKRIP